MKNLKIFWENIILDNAKQQMLSAMDNDFVIKWALMPDSHLWYSLPIWWVVQTKDVVVPAWVWYDIWCWMCALNTWLKLEDLKWLEKNIFDKIYEVMPLSHWNYHEKDQDVSFDHIPKTQIAEDIIKKFHAKRQVGTLWGWNHFIEIAYDDNNFIWVVVHSWSRWIWHKIWSYYMDYAKMQNFSDPDLINKLEKEFDENPKYENVRKHNPEKYWEIRGMNVDKEIQKLSKWNSEGHYWLDVNSDIWKDYIMDMEFCMEFALISRELMMKTTLDVISEITGKEIDVDFTIMENGWGMINRNHNHCTHKNWLYIHRKGATHSEEGMFWIIPANMRDGSFVVKWKWNPDSLCSSSHWAWRVLWRKQADKILNVKDFEKQMEGIVAKVGSDTLDESPSAYKDINEVMNAQYDNIEVINYLKPIINIKW